MVPIAFIYAMATVMFGLFIINDYLKTRHLRWRFSGVAFRYSLAVTLMSFVSSLWLLWIMEDGPAFVGGCIHALLQWPLLFIYVSVGVRYARKLQTPGSIFWKRLSKYPLSKDEDPGRVNHIHSLKTETGKMLYTSSLHPEYIEIQSLYHEPSDSLSSKWWLKFDVIVVLSVAAAAIYTVVLFNLTRPEASEMIKMIQSSNDANTNAELSSVLLMLIFTRLAITEEFFFRLALQPFLEWQFRRNQYAPILAIVLSSIFWSLGHVGVLVPEWVKLAQIFPFGVALGLINRRYGIEAAILIHVVFNVTMIFITPGFISL